MRLLEYLRRREMPAAPSDLLDHKYVGYANWPGPGVDTWRFVRDDLSFDVDVRSRLTMNNAAALLRAALAGFGMVFAAEDLAREALSAGGLVPVLPNHETASRPIRLLYHPDRRQTRKLRSFIDAVVEQLGRYDADGGRA